MGFTTLQFHLIIKTRIEENGLTKFTKILWDLIPEPDDSENYEKHEACWNEYLLWLRTEYFRRFDQIEFEEAINNLLTDNKL